MARGSNAHGDRAQPGLVRPHCRADGRGTSWGRGGSSASPINAPDPDPDIATGGWMLSSHRSLTRLGGLAAIAALPSRPVHRRGPRRAPSAAASVAAPPSAAASAAASSAASGAPSAAASAADMTALIAAAKAEGALTTIALPRDWCNYGAAIDGFTEKYGITINGPQPRWRLEGRAGRDHRQQGQSRTGRAGRRRRRARVRPAGRRPGPLPAVQGRDLGHHPGLGQVGRRHVVRRLLRRHVVRGQHQGRHHRPEGLARPPEARLQEERRAVR